MPDDLVLTWSLHQARKAKDCAVCGTTIPEGGQYWRSKAPRSARASLILCCLCHVLYGCSTDGWVEPADGEQVVTALRTAQ